MLDLIKAESALAAVELDTSAKGKVNLQLVIEQVNIEQDSKREPTSRHCAT
jgi:hypothetical protein